jgi:hypothetical protein
MCEGVIKGNGVRFEHLPVVKKRYAESCETGTKLRQQDNEAQTEFRDEFHFKTVR